MKEYYEEEECKSIVENMTIIKHKVQPQRTQNRKMADCLVVCKHDLVSFSKPSAKFGVSQNFPFNIVGEEFLKKNQGWSMFEYEFFDNSDKAVKNMAVNSYNYYKQKKDVIMTQTYINLIDYLKEENPELWI